MHKRMEALTFGAAGRVAEQRLRLLIGHLDRHLGRRLLHIEFRDAPCVKRAPDQMDKSHHALMCNRSKVAPLAQGPPWSGLFGQRQVEPSNADHTGDNATRLSGQFATMGMRNNGLAQAPVAS